MTEPTFSEALEAGRLLTLDGYAQRIACHRERAKRKAIFNMTLIAIAAVVLTAAIATVTARASSPHRATPAVQLVVDRLVGHHVPKLMQECRARKCAAFTRDGNLQVILVERFGHYTITSAASSITETR